MERTLALGIIGVGIAAISAYLHVNDKDGSGWGLVAFCFLVSSCSVTP
jgi:hypothetical protein